MQSTKFRCCRLRNTLIKNDNCCQRCLAVGGLAWLGREKDRLSQPLTRECYAIYRKREQGISRTIKWIYVTCLTGMLN